MLFTGFQPGGWNDVLVFDQVRIQFGAGNDVLVAGRACTLCRCGKKKQMRLPAAPKGFNEGRHRGLPLRRLVTYDGDCQVAWGLEFRVAGVFTLTLSPSLPITFDKSD